MKDAGHTGIATQVLGRLLVVSRTPLDDDFQTKGITRADGAIPRVSVIIDPTTKADGILRQEAPNRGIVVAISIVIELVSIVLAPGELRRVCAEGAGRRRCPEWL